MIAHIYRFPTRDPQRSLVVGFNAPSGEVIFKVEIDGVRVDNSVVVLKLPAFSLLASLLGNTASNTRRLEDGWPEFPMYNNEQIKEFKLEGEKIV